MEHIYKMCFYGGLTCAIFLFILSIFLFIKFNIPKVFGDLSGNSEKKSIKGMNAITNKRSMAQKGEQEKYYRGHSEKIKARESKTDETETSLMLTEEMNAANAATFEAEGKTGVLTAVDSEGETGVLTAVDSEGETGVLTAVDSEGETGVLTASESEGETGVLTALDEEETSVLIEDDIDEATTVLSARNMHSFFDPAEAETMVLATYEEETLYPEDGETSVLAGNEETSLLVEEEAQTGILTNGEIVSTKMFKKEESTFADSEQIIEPRINKLEGKTKVYFDAVVVHTNESL